MARREQRHGGVHAGRAGTYDAHYTPYAVEGDTVVARGTSVYQDHPDGPVTRTFDNCFLIRFDGDGRCAEFTELYMERPR